MEEEEGEEPEVSGEGWLLGMHRTGLRHLEMQEGKDPLSTMGYLERTRVLMPRSPTNRISNSLSDKMNTTANKYLQAHIIQRAE